MAEKTRAQCEKSRWRQTCSKANIRLFAIVPIHLKSLGAEQEFGPRWLTELAAKTGGRAIRIQDDDPHWSFKKSKEQMLSLARKFWLEVVGSGYLLTIQLPPNLKPPRWKLHLDTLEASN
jgi:hypothetical protein